MKTYEISYCRKSIGVEPVICQDCTYIVYGDSEKEALKMFHTIQQISQLLFPYDYTITSITERKDENYECPFVKGSE